MRFQPKISCNSVILSRRHKVVAITSCFHGSIGAFLGKTKVRDRGIYDGHTVLFDCRRFAGQAFDGKPQLSQVVAYLVLGHGQHVLSDHVSHFQRAGLYARLFYAQAGVADVGS